MKTNGTNISIELLVLVCKYMNELSYFFLKKSTALKSMHKAESMYMKKLGDYKSLTINTSSTCGLKNSTVFHSSSAFFFSRYLNDDSRWALARSVSGRANLTWKTSQHNIQNKSQVLQNCKDPLFQNNFKLKPVTTLDFHGQTLSSNK